MPRFARGWAVAFLTVFVAHAAGTTAELLGTGAPAGLTAAYRLLLSALNLSFTLAFTLGGYLLVRYLAAAPPAAPWPRVLTLWRTAARGLGALYCVVLLIGFGLEPGLAAARHLPYSEPARLSAYVLGLSNLDKLRIQPASWRLAELWAVAVVGQWLVAGGLLLAALPRRWWAAGLGAVLLASVGFQVRHVPETLLLKLHSAAIFTDFAVGGLVALLPRPVRRGTGYAALAGVVGLALTQRAWLGLPALAPAYRLVSSGLVGVLLLTPWAALPGAAADAALRWLGRRTYAAYGLHTVALGLTATGVAALPPGPAPAGAWLVAPLGLGLTVGLAALAHRWLVGPWVAAPPPNQKTAADPKASGGFLR